MAPRAPTPKLTCRQCVGVAEHVAVLGQLMVDNLPVTPSFKVVPFYGGFFGLRREVLEVHTLNKTTEKRVLQLSSCEAQWRVSVLHDPRMHSLERRRFEARSICL